ncbi:MAG: GFA family protein [Candidatus Magasanikbacteria bacterium CG_4_9_14_0_2_um_filter_42_11]|uniref:GFA family protein n=1 Tax=Candidatus Magasanikbacteria bacterium CG_4_9_14_0_2_um_filter_42_11 TaxID=1974643 RepID=A0A2M8FA82_9BACT|nr:MAG: GFA family protein [Candidatus Magasanikbacteria bacterium CG10_big_fil_rev_8_21_14_0_10_43_9]PIY92303.1 MAG: GFA family protein [Candidatus Magasanikbacteria bacterium CG_4_10_14_0_8_um_filter_42_12]PJC52631.1 MAG: GFA family protein [Candidatus Magasanikbacteria bacterium CG_4_9_14_0_2_um_filter_42_11]
MNEQRHHGSCHCGAVAYDVTMSLDNTITCNCSMCGRAGTILAFVPAEKFTLLSGEDNLTSYTFNKKIIDHLFCNVCGIKPFGRGKDQDGNDTVAVNVRCLEDVDLTKLEPYHYDGKNA